MIKDVFINNRKNLLEKVEDNSAVIFFAGKAPIKSADEDYDFTPNRNFYYLTGIDEPTHILVLTKVNGENKDTLFILRPDLEKEKWVGKSIRPNEVTEVSGIEDVQYLDTFETVINRLITSGAVEKYILT